MKKQSSKLRRTTVCLVGALVAALHGTTAYAQVERDAEDAKNTAQMESSDVEGKAYEAQRPASLPDLTKGEKLPEPTKGGPITWNMGQTGIIGIKNGGFAGDQVQVVAVLPGSPAEGKILPGDVVLGVQGRDFVAGGHLGVMVGDAIIKAEEEAGKGVFAMHIWRDRNWIKRNSTRNVFGIDIEKLFKAAESESDLYEWSGEEQRTAAVEKMAFDEFPLDGFHTNVTLQLTVMGTYSETSPWDCPVAAKIREDACRVIAAQFAPDKNGRSHGDWPGVLALVASGKPEYVELARTWVHSQKLCSNINAKVELKNGGMLSWHRGFNSLETAIYYDATGDDYVLPEVRYRAIETAMGQSGGGSWGHTFAFPSFNGGQLHGVNPGYGALNAAGNRCFFLLTMAKKAGIKDPEIDAAIARASSFFGSYVDKGCIPYGDHPPAPSDDSNGKNYGAAYAFYTLGKTYEAKYFAMHSTHASFSRRGGHGSPTLWYYSPLSANIAGPRGVQAAMRNMRWFFTLSRRHDGSFVFQGEQAGIGGKGMRNPTATHAMFYSVPLKKLVITGKDVDESCWFNDKELEELLVSARAQVTDTQLLSRIGKPWPERGTDELIGMLDHFYPNMRRALAKELAKRFEAGEKEIIPKVLAVLTSKEARARDGACLTLSACGKDTMLTSLSKITPLLDDPAEFVRMTAVRAIGGATEPADQNRNLLMLQSAAADYEPMSKDLGNVRTAVRDVLFSGGRKGSTATESKLATDPFEAGFDYNLVRSALENIVTMDPGGKVPGTWSRETLVRMAGPVVFVADEIQVMDAMFGGARRSGALALLEKYGYREAVEGNVSYLLKRRELEPVIRRTVTFKVPCVTPALVKKAPGQYRFALEPFHQWLQDDPVCVISEKQGKDIPPIITPLEALIEMIEADDSAKPLPSIGAEVEQMFLDELAKAGDAGAKVDFCRAELKDPEKRNFFRKMAAMTQLVALRGSEAVDDLAPYLGHVQWRVREHAHKLALELVKGGALDRLAAQLAKARGENAAAMLMVLRDAGLEKGLGPAKAALRHPEAVVRRAAVQAVMALGGDSALPEILAFMGGTNDPDDLRGCEQALLLKRDDSASAGRVRDAAMAMFPKATPEQRRSLAWVLAQLGGPDGLAFLQRAASGTKDDAELEAIVLALSYSPDRGADRVMIDLAKQDERILDAVAAQSVRRMVGPNGVTDVTDAQRMDFAESMLRMKHDARLITYLGHIHTGRAIRTLAELMKEGSTALAAKSIIAAAEGMNNPPAAEAKIAADALAQVIEYIEVSYLRGGVAAHMSKEGDYAGWKATQARAGKALLKVHRPGKEPVSGFDDSMLDL